MGEVVSLKSAVATTATFQSVLEYPATGALSVVLGKATWPDRPPEWIMAVRAPGAPDMMIASGPWPEGWPDEAWGEPLAIHVNLALAVLAIARKRLPALTTDGGPDAPMGAA